MTSFNLKLDLLMADTFSLEQLNKYAADIAAASAFLLHSHGITTCVRMCTSAASVISPPPTLVQHLAPFLSSIDLYSVPAEQTAPFHPAALRCSAFTPAHITALQSCSTSLRALCISDQKLSHGPDALALAQSIPGIAQLSSLTKLHLSLAYNNPVADFQPLSQLRALEDLALQCSGSPASCSDVLLSCRHTLRMVTLAACGWSLETYVALAQAPYLQTLVVKLWAFSSTQAVGISFLKAASTKLELLNFGNTSEPALLALNTLLDELHIDELSLWGVTDGIGILGSMWCLRRLAIVNSPDFTGCTLAPQPNVKQLKLVSCPSVGAEGLRHMLGTALPALRTLAFHATDNDNSCVHVNPEVLDALLCGSCLSSIDLRGMCGLTSANVVQLRSTFNQTLSAAHPYVTIQLPHTTLRLHQPVIAARCNLYLPTLHLLPGHGKSRRLQLRFNVEPDTDLFENALLLCYLYIVCKYVKYW